MSTKKVSIKEAKPDKLFYITANAVVYRKEDGRCLLLKRSEHEKVHPGKWTTIGEKIEHQNLDLEKPSRIEGDVLVFENIVLDTLQRGAQEEAGITIQGEPKYLGAKIIIRPDGIPVMVLLYGVLYVSGEVQPQVGDFTDSVWVNATEIDQYDCIQGIADEVKAAIDLLESVKE